MCKCSEHVQVCFSLRDCFHQEQEFEDIWLEYSKAPGRIIAVDLKARMLGEGCKSCFCCFLQDKKVGKTHKDRCRLKDYPLFGRSSLSLLQDKKNKRTRLGLSLAPL